MHVRTLALVLLSVVACSSPPRTAAVSAPPPVAPIAAPAVAAPAPVVVDDATPLDPAIKKATLPNGLTYYVMKHAKPEQRAQLWLAVNAGSVQEDDDQRGLAHFVEHMAFNGTKRFAKQAIINYIEKVGMRFGPDVNAYTSFDETVYQLTVPTDDRTVMMTGLDILRDWAGDVSFDPVEVDKERGVVTEEWRLGRGAFARINDKQWPVMFQGSKYAERLPIGLPEILKKAPRETLVRFYKDWYRPENMAVIVVGDVDPAMIEKAIVARFGDLKSEGQPRKRVAVAVPHAHDTLVTIATDPEMPFSQVEVVDKMDHRSERTKQDYRRTIVEWLYQRMLNARFQELALDPGAPFTSAGAWTSGLTRTSDGFNRNASAKQGRTAETLAVLFREIERVEQHGFSQSELDRAMRDQLSEAETSAAEWEKTQSDAIADEMTRNFFEDEQMPGRPYELQLNKEILPTVTLAEMNKLARTWGGEMGRVVAISGPAKAKMPTEPEVRAIVAASNAKVEAWKDTPPRPLLAQAPVPGKILETTEDKAAGATVWKLSNGVRVIVKPTTFQNDSIEISGWKPGGSSLIPNHIDARFADDIVGTGGGGDLDPVALKKALAGKVADVGIYFSELAENVHGSARPADLETAMQLLHVKLTQPRKDVRAFAAWRDDQLEWARNRRLMPEVSFYEDMESIRSKNHPRRQPMTPEMLAKVDLERAHQIWRARMADLGSFTFTFVGNVDAAKLRPLVETYLASLPSKGKVDKWKDVGVTYATGKVQKTVVAGTEPKSYVSMTFGGPDTWSRDAERDARILAMVLRIRLREVLREDMGGVYGVRSYVYLARQPKVRREAGLQWGCDPQNVEKLRDAALGVIRAVQKDGISDEYLAKVKEQLRRARETDAKENWWWANALHEAYWFGEDFTDATNLEPVLARVTSDGVKAAAKRFFDERNLVIGVMRPRPSGR